VIYREAGQFKSSYAADMAVFPLKQDRIGIVVIILLAYSMAFFGSTFMLQAVLIPFLIFALAAIGLNMLSAIPVCSPSAPGPSWGWGPMPATN